jgi:predicted metalloprotease
MTFDNSNIDLSGVDDRRGSPGGGLGGGLGGRRGMAVGGGGVVGLVVLVLVVLLGGNPLAGQANLGLPGGVDAPAGTGESREELQARCSSSEALDTYVDCRLIKAYNVLNDTWSEEFTARGRTYEPPGLVFFSRAVSTGCGTATSEVGPFYCPADRSMYFDLQFLEQLQQQFGASGRFAQIYILAHEGGHHLQTLLGIEPQVRRAQRADPRRTNELSVRLELQADCLAGVWSTLADRNEGEGLVLSEQDVREALGAAAAVGDDRIQEKVQGRISPEGFTHGSAEQRQRWLDTGLRSADLDACDTFTPQTL